MTLLAALKIVLRYLTNRQESVVGTDVANRVLVETQQLIGFFVNQLVLRTTLAGSLSFQDVIRRVRRTTLDAYEHQEVPFDRLVEELRPERTLNSLSPFFQVKLVLQNTPQPAPPLGQLTFEPVEIQSGAAKFDILINVREEPQGLCAALHYRADLFSINTAQRIVGLFQRVVDLVAADATITLDEINQHLRQRERDRANLRETEFQESSRRSLSAARRVRVTAA
jgi:non-ribosomal peptide synthetase component F